MSKLITVRQSRVVVLLLAVVALFAAACSSDSGSPSKTVTKTGSQPPAAATTAPTSQTPTAAPKTVVKVTTNNSDGATYGVGMPVIAFFSKKITNAKQWQAGTKVTVDGKPLAADWYFQSSSAGNGPIEAQLRPKDYWPAHSKIHITMPKAGTSLGGNFVNDGKLSSLDFSIGPRNIVTVDDSDNRVTVTSDGKKWDSFPTSLGAKDTRTKRGTKVIMEQVKTTCMQDLKGTYRECGIKWDSRLTYDGEYLHAAPWNVSNIENGVNSSNGCSNLLPADAEKLYKFVRVGDVVTFPNADGPRMQMGQGYGLWNVSWSEYQTGGLVATR